MFRLILYLFYNIFLHIKAMQFSQNIVLFLQIVLIYLLQIVIMNYQEIDF